MTKALQKNVRRNKVRRHATAERNITIVALCETKTLNEIAQQFGISRQRVNEIWKRSKLAESGQKYAPKKPRKKSIPMKHEEAIVWAVDHHWKTHFRAPTFREIQTLTGISSTSHVSYTVARIAEKYKWRISSDMSRTITPQWVVQAIEQASPK